MASKKFLDLQETSESDLKDMLAEYEASYRKLTFDHAIKGLDNPLELKVLRRDVARLKTEIRRRELVACAPEELAKRSKIRLRRRKAK